MVLKLVKGRASFLDLPPELRNRIYQDVLIHSEPIRISDGRWSWFFELTWVKQEAGHELQARCPIQISVLRSCKRICAEAAPLLYGANIFYLRPESFERFIAVIGDMKRFIRIVSLTSISLRRLSIKTYKQLRHFPQLRQVTLDPSCSRSFVKPTSMAWVLLPLVRTLHKRNNSTDGKAAKVAIVLVFKDLSDPYEEPWRKEAGMQLIKEAILIIHAALKLDGKEKIAVSIFDHSTKSEKC